MLGAFYRLQVDFGIMQWQQFSHNRKPVTLFSPTDSVKQWLNKQNKSSISSEFGYGESIAEEEYIEIRLPETVKASLNNGEYVMLNEDYSITPIIEQENMTNN